MGLTSRFSDLEAFSPELFQKFVEKHNLVNNCLQKRSTFKNNYRNFMIMRGKCPDWHSLVDHLEAFEDNQGRELYVSHLYEYNSRDLMIFSEEVNADYLVYSKAEDYYYPDQAYLVVFRSKKGGG